MPTMVMTGGTSGFGAHAARRLTLSNDVRLILGARRPTSAGEFVPLDLAELDSARAFAKAVHERLGGVPVDALVLNAGVVLPDVTGRTLDGLETTFAVNHLAHYLLARLLLLTLADGAVVVLTTSGTHDPDTRSGLRPPRHADAELLAHPDRDPGRDTRPRRAGEHAYTASKLCVALTARSLSEHPDARARRVRVVAYDPGQVFGTGLARDLPFPLGTAWSLLGTPALGWPLRRLNRNLNSRAAAGHTLADLALGLAKPPSGRTYAALRRGRLTWPDPSRLARRDDVARALWNDSARLVGLPG
ncbi:SDR family NAD(P)-dependent oxidoreductase [Frankia sp. CNm7]|uniref:SDR family NAD(P)-dependent oxidoreductase n=1 Tax=Frankia nepalensis TaxID=1836974 RepID=A0A937UP45_9ACTN|nr:SDR family NAD(P)-dependent oxidoreductase [Frankia nepalensis]MBL7496116.1 SDR family NAD(P)-dependent oxidoreductase [Frankia nepalensis]MBL7508945.1 SDR family NAD(P)-dependent oxidoreductase [Frankia nepalensis]MBL7516785.1 SDR family NAD(P)-dependent oxidoreductase [Frankia nepalensis]MBL7628723.1 SDR family NAD(P)-dependent oxidoreductase [Frankia nepalensis]